MENCRQQRAEGPPDIVRSGEEGHAHTPAHTPGSQACILYLKARELDGITLLLKAALLPCFGYVLCLSSPRHCFPYLSVPQCLSPPLPEHRSRICYIRYTTFLSPHMPDKDRDPSRSRGSLCLHSLRSLSRLHSPATCQPSRIVGALFGLLLPSRFPEIFGSPVALFLAPKMMALYSMKA